MHAKLIKWILAILTIIALMVGAILAAGIVKALHSGAQIVNGDLSFDHELFIPPEIEGHIDGENIAYSLDIGRSERRFGDRAATETWAFGLEYLGPTIRVRKGQQVRIDVTNRLPQSATVHWHGMILPAEMDGGPHQPIASGETWRAEWTVLNEAATYWYHPHSLHRTGQQVYRGLAGFLIVEDENSDSLGLPSDYGIDDIPLVIQDRRFDENGEFIYTPERPDPFGDPGMLGDTILVNGTVAPFAEVPRSMVRLRILNGSNARRYNLGFADDRSFHQIASDGGFLNRPVEMNRLMLAPGERAEIIIDLSDDHGPLMLMSHAIYDRNLFFTGAKTLADATRDENQSFNLLELRPVREPIPSGQLPDRLNNIPELVAHEQIETDWRLELARNLINGRRMDHDRIDRTTRAGDEEVWEVTALDMSHPFHVHGTQFRILDRDGEAPPANERGWKDTVLVNQDERVRILVPMPPYGDPHVPFMFHCHILEHEDSGMMGQFLVLDE